MRTKLTCIAVCLWAVPWAIRVGEASAQEAAPSLAPAWQIDTLKHQFEARDIFERDGCVYVGGDAPKGKVSKVEMATGKIAWSYDTGQSYQPSYPVSNGKVVAFATYYDRGLVALDDATGKLQWVTKPPYNIMSAVCFADDLAFAGTQQGHFCAFDWAKGEVRWQIMLGTYFWSTPCVYKDLVLVGNRDGNLYAVERQTGKLAWRIDCGGAVESNPVAVGDLVFVTADVYNAKEDATRARHTMLVINVTQKTIRERFVAKGVAKAKVSQSGDDVFYFDERCLFSYSAKQEKLSWRYEPPPGVLPYPLMMDSTIILAMNAMGHHDEHTSSVVVLDRATGKQLASSDRGGIGLRQTHYVQSGNLVVTADGRLRAYRIVKAP